jgi:hypothetical protein
MPRKVLIVSYIFPTVGGIGVQSALSLPKYLPRCGYEVHILKATKAGGPVRDHALLEQVPDCVMVHEAFAPEIRFTIRQKLCSRFLRRPREQPTTAGPAAPGGWKRLLARFVTRLLCPEPELLWVPFARRQARRVIRDQNIEFALVTVAPFSALVVRTTLKKERARNWAKQAVRRVRQGFSIDSMVHNYARLYESLGQKTTAATVSAAARA